jgi:hypothetical protein
MFGLTQICQKKNAIFEFQGLLGKYIPKKFSSIFAFCSVLPNMFIEF